MKKFTRRKAIGLIGGATVLTAISLNSCCFIRQILKVPCDSLKVWKKTGSKWWGERKKQREEEKLADINSGKRVKIDLPKPFLDINQHNRGPHGYPIDQFQYMHLNELTEVWVKIMNKGNAPAWNCVVEAYEAPAFCEHIKYSDFILNDRIMVHFMPGEDREVKLKYHITKPTYGSMVLRCYDPFCDPSPLTYIIADRHATAFYWDNLNNNH